MAWLPPIGENNRRDPTHMGEKIRKYEEEAEQLILKVVEGGGDKIEKSIKKLIKSIRHDQVQ